MSNVRPAHRVLILDDETLILKALRRTLRQDPYEVEVFSDPRAALEALRTFRPDVVISDHMMPQMTGLEFLELARERLPDSLRMMLTGHADMQTAIDSLNHGAVYRFITKPWDDVELKTTLHLACEHIDLQREQRLLLSRVRCQQAVLDRLMREYPGLAQFRRDEGGAILIDEAELEDEPVRPGAAA